jgi:hypothetical protein
MSKKRRVASRQRTTASAWDASFRRSAGRRIERSSYEERRMTEIQGWLLILVLFGMGIGIERRLVAIAAALRALARSQEAGVSP